MLHYKNGIATLYDSRMQDMHHEFDKIIKHWLESDFIEELPHSAISDKNAFYLPFFAVLEALTNPPRR